MFIVLGFLKLVFLIFHTVLTSNRLIKILVPWSLSTGNLANEIVSSMQKEPLAKGGKQLSKSKKLYYLYYSLQRSKKFVEDQFEYDEEEQLSILTEMFMPNTKQKILAHHSVDQKQPIFFLENSFHIMYTKAEFFKHAVKNQFNSAQVMPYLHYHIDKAHAFPLQGISYCSLRCIEACKIPGMT